LGFKGKGVAKLRVKVVKAPEPEEAKYSKHRSYAHVPGDIGEYSSVEEAEKGMAVAYALKASATSLLAPVTSSVFSAPNHEFLVAEAPQVWSRALTRLASIGAPKSGLAALLEEHDTYEAIEPEPETIANAPVAEIDTAAATENVTAKEPQTQVAAAIASDALKTQPVTRASSKKMRTRSASNSKRKRKVVSHRSQPRNKRAVRRRGAKSVKRVRTAAVGSKQPKRYRFHANSITEFQRRHMRRASSS
jgi:rare lipoprotein A